MTSVHKIIRFEGYTVYTLKKTVVLHVLGWLECIEHYNTILNLGTLQYKVSISILSSYYALLWRSSVSCKGRQRLTLNRCCLLTVLRHYCKLQTNNSNSTHQQPVSLQLQVTKATVTTPVYISTLRQHQPCHNY